MKEETDSDEEDQDEEENCLDAGCDKFKELFSVEENNASRVILRLVKVEEGDADQKPSEDANEQQNNEDAQEGKESEGGDGGEGGDKDYNQFKDLPAESMKFLLVPSDQNFNAVKLIVQKVESGGWLLRMTNSLFEFYHLIEIPTKRMILKKVVEGLRDLERRLTQVKALNRLHHGEKEFIVLKRDRCEMLFRRVVLQVLGERIITMDDIHSLNELIKTTREPKFEKTEIQFFMSQRDQYAQKPVMRVELQNVVIEDVRAIKIEVELFSSKKQTLFQELTTFPDMSMFNVYSVIEDYFTHLVLAIKRMYYSEAHHMVSPYPSLNSTTSAEDFKSIEPVEQTPEFEIMGGAPYQTEVTKTDFILGPVKTVVAEFDKKNCDDLHFLIEHRMCVFFNYLKLTSIPDIDYYVKKEADSTDEGEGKGERRLGLLEQVRKWVRKVL